MSVSPHQILDDYDPADAPPIPTITNNSEPVRPKTYVEIGLDVGPGVVAMMIGVPLAQPIFEQAFNWAINRCSRCGRFNHTIFRCYAKTRSDGSRL